MERDAGRNVVCIFGSARSGTTLLAKMFDASPEVLYRHEPDISLPTDDIPFLPCKDLYLELAGCARVYMEALAGLKTSRTIGSPPYFPKKFRSSFGNICWRANAYVAKAASRLGVEAPISDWTPRSAKPVVVMKSVSSVVRAPLIHDALSGARIIHIVRHPCAVIASRRRGLRSGYLQDGKSINDLRTQPTYIDSVLNMVETANYPFGVDQVRSMGFAGQSAYVWMLQNDKVFSELVGSPRYKFVKYEDLCLNVVNKVQELYSFAGLEWAEQVAKFVEELDGFESRKDSFFGVKRNIRSGLDKWRVDLSEEDIREICDVVQHSALGRQFTGDEDEEFA